MWLWIVLVVLAVMATALAYALCVASSREDRWQEAHPPKSGKGRKDAYDSRDGRCVCEDGGRAGH